VRARSVRSRGLALWLALFAAYAATLGLDATRGERFSPREAHILLTTESIVSGGDIDLRDEYARRAWREFGGPALQPTASVVGGRLVESHGVGLPLLLAPAYALGGATAAELWVAALLALAFVLAAALARRLVPDPWATAGTLVGGLSPPALAAATTISPEGPGALALAGAVTAALALRERPRFWVAVAGAVAVGATPWLALPLAAAGAVCAVVLARWLLRRAGGLTALVALEVVLFSAVAYVTLYERLFGALGPYAPSLAPDGPTGAGSVAEVLGRAPRLVGLWLDRDVGVLRWAPFAALAFYALWLLWRSRRDRLRVAVADQVDVEVTAALLAAVCAAQVAVAAFLAPALHGAWGPGRLLVPVLPLIAALAAWGLRFAPRAGAALAAATLVASAWVLLGLRLGDGGLAPLAGDVPWGGLQDVLPRFGGPGGLDAGAAALIAAVVVALVALVARERG
jgi:hypothetical protein